MTLSEGCFGPVAVVGIVSSCLMLAERSYRLLAMYGERMLRQLHLGPTLAALSSGQRLG